MPSLLTHRRAVHFHILLAISHDHDFWNSFWMGLFSVVGISTGRALPFKIIVFQKCSSQKRFKCTIKFSINKQGTGFMSFKNLKSEHPWIDWACSIQNSITTRNRLFLSSSVVSQSTGSIANCFFRESNSRKGQEIYISNLDPSSKPGMMYSSSESWGKSA